MKLHDYLIENVLSEKEFADQIGVKQPTISRYINKYRIPKKHILQKISEVTKDQVNENDFAKQIHWKQRVVNGQNAKK
tara:strand:+ start:1860 stop:2093 length:234 start_codon:yes stop_codon:yes gene_type:complete